MSHVLRGKQDEKTFLSSSRRYSHVIPFRNAATVQHLSPPNSARPPASASPFSGIGLPRFYENYFCGSERNYTGYCNAEVDKLIDQQSVETG